VSTRSTLAAVILVACGLRAFAAPAEDGAAAPPGKEPALEWLRQPGAALRRALQRRSEILAVFGGKSCPWCRRLEVETLESPDVRSLLQARVLLQVDVDGSPEVARSLGILSIPDIRLFNAEGVLLARRTGFVSAGELAAWIEQSSRGAPRPGEPSLAGLRPDPGLDPYLELESGGALPGAEGWQTLLAMAAGPSGETRAEALRLVKLWAPGLARGLVESLESPRLKVRLAAREALLELGAPVDGIDPYARPAAGTGREAVAMWLAEYAPPEAPARVSRGRIVGKHGIDEKDLDALEGEDATRRAAARDRLIAAGEGIVEGLRERGRSLRASAPTAAARVDEVRFRILLPPQVVRRLPDASERLSVGDGASRSRALSETLALGAPGLGPLVREALCDPDPFFRETAAASVPTTLGEESTAALADLLDDSEPNVRAGALRALAKGGAAGATEAIGRYLGTERDPALIAHAARALQEAGGHAAIEALRPLLSSEHWTVRAAAVEALAKLKDAESFSRILALLEDPDLFVASQAAAAASSLGGEPLRDEVVAALSEALKRPELAVQAIRVLSGSVFRKSSRALGVIRGAARHGNADVRVAAVEALSTARDPGARDAIIAGLEDPDVRVRRAAVAGVRSLLELPQVFDVKEDSRAALLEGLNGDDASLRLECALTLMHAGDVDTARSDWLQSLLGGDRSLRERALLGFQWLATETWIERAASDLWDVATDAEHERILQAITWNHRDADPTSALLLLLPRVPDGSRPAWARALVRSHLDDGIVAGGVPGPDRESVLARVEAAARTAGGTADRALLDSLALVLGAEEKQLRSGLRDRRSVVRRAALLAHIMKRLPVPAGALEALARDPEPEVRTLALYASMPPELRASFVDEARHWLGSGHIERRVTMSPRAGRVSSGGTDLPAKLLEERLRDESPAVRLRAAALIASGGEGDARVVDDALGELHRWWREEPHVGRLQILLRALERNWEDRRLPVLEEIYEALDPADQNTIQVLRRTVDAIGEGAASLKERMDAERGRRGASDDLPL
jgi:HEAT repeat protein